MKKRKRVRYYFDEKNDDFRKNKTKLKLTIDGDYKYIPKNPLFKVFSFGLYYFIALPILFVLSFTVYGARVKGRKNLKKVKKDGYCIYCNHTNYTDAWLGAVLVARPKLTYVISSKYAVQIPFVRVLTKALGCLPIGDTVSSIKSLNESVGNLLNKKKAVMIFPEAHIWDFYTGVRPFPITSFKFPASSHKPIVPVAVTYRQPKIFFKNTRKPKMIVNIGEPIMYDENLTEKQNALYFRDATMEFIREKTGSPDNYEYIQYIKVEEREQSDAV